MKVTKKLLLVTLFFLQAYLIRFQIGPYPTNLQEILIGLTALAFLIESIKEKRLPKIQNHPILLTFIALTIISILTTQLPNQLDFIRHSKFLFFAIITTFIFTETLNKKERHETLRFAGLGAILFGLFSLAYNLIGLNVAHDLRLLGPLDAAVYLAFYLAPFFLLFSFDFLKNTKDKKALASAIILALLLLATRSMGAIGATFLTLIFFTLKNSKIFTKKTAKLALIPLVIIVGGLIFYTKVLPALQTNYSSLDERGEIWKTSIHLLKDPKTLLLGTGFGQFQHYYETTVDSVLSHPPLDYKVLQPHNVFFLFIFQYGILGLAFLFFLIYKTLTNLKSPYAFITLYFLIHGLIDTPFFKNDLLILLLIFLQLTYFNPDTKSINTA
ncbi:MAG: O-antigen ligase family protein [Candidatus Peregrinibacteria bacterium]